MSKSKRKPYIKDRGLTTQEYWKPIRHNWKQHLKQNYLDPDLNFESPKTYINDYNYCDYWWVVEESKSYIIISEELTHIGWNKEDVKKYSRK
jgi:hypothetical protein